MTQTDHKPANRATLQAAGPDPGLVFADSWLALRAEADRRARAAVLDKQLAMHLRRRLAGGQTLLNLIDLGTGSGANAVYLAPRLPGLQHWHLFDHDAALLARATTRVASAADEAGRTPIVSSRCGDLVDRVGEGFHGMDLVTASALIDLVGDRWLRLLADQLAAAGAALLVTLSVDGGWRFLDAGGRPVSDPDDNKVCALFNAHQRRDKGPEGALGAAAAPNLVRHLQTLGLVVMTAPSPWRLALDRADDRALALALLQGWLDAAIEQSPGEAEGIRRWGGRRRAWMEIGSGGIEVGHVDVLALPATRSDD